MRLFLASTLTLLILTCNTAVVGAESAAALDPVIVTATRIPTPESQVASSVTMITAEDIAAKQYQTLPDVLRDVPGLNVVQSGGAGGQTSLFMRGTEARHTKVFVDGIDVSNPASPDGGFDFGTFLAQDIEKVEILRGPQSGLYGSDAIGGVVNIITKSGNGPARFTASIQGGSFNTFNQSAGVTGSSDQFHYAATIDHMNVAATPVTPHDLLPKGVRRVDDYTDNLTGTTKLSYDLTDQLDVGLVGRYTETRLRITGDNPNLYPSPPEGQQTQNNTNSYYTRGTVHLISFAGVFEQTLGVAYSNITLNDIAPATDGPPTTYLGDRLKLDWQGKLKLDSTETLLFGAEHQRDEVRQPIPASTVTDAGFAELQSTLSEHLFNTLNVRYDNNDRFGSKTTYRVAPVYLISRTDTKLKASIGTGFKAPTLEEMYQNIPAYGFYANPNLRPETSFGYDLGFEQSIPAYQLTGGATYFRNDIRDLIAGNATYTTLINVGRAHTQGVESFLRYRPLKTLTLRLDYTYTEAVDDVLREPLLRRPKHKASLNANWQASARLSFTATILGVSQWVDGNRDFSVPRLDAAGYTTVNLAANFALTDKVALFGRLNNLFDRRYEDPIGFLQPGVGAFAGVRVTF